jgi:hypothetical protein
MNVRNYFPCKVLKLEKFIYAMTALYEPSELASSRESRNTGRGGSVVEVYMNECS